MVGGHAGRVLAAEGTVFGLGVPERVNRLIAILKIATLPESASCNQCGLCCIGEACELSRELGDAECAEAWADIRSSARR